jgi:hypothetical protein
MNSEAPRRRASDQQSISSPRAPRPAWTPDSIRPEARPDATAGRSLEPGFSHLGSGRANASRERRQRNIEWYGPERRISTRL